MNVTYDPALDAAYVTIGREWRPVALTCPVDGTKAGAYIHLDFDNTGRLVGIEALEARRLLPEELLIEDRGAVRAHYDPEADAATIYLWPQFATTGKPAIAHTQSCNLPELDGHVSPLCLHFDADDRLIAIEVSDASRALPKELLAAAASHPASR